MKVIWRRTSHHTTPTVDDGDCKSKATLWEEKDDRGRNSPPPPPSVIKNTAKTLGDDSVGKVLAVQA